MKKYVLRYNCFCTVFLNRCGVQKSTNHGIVLTYLWLWKLVPLARFAILALNCCPNIGSLLSTSMPSRYGQSCNNLRSISRKELTQRLTTFIQLTFCVSELLGLCPGGVFRIGLSLVATLSTCPCLLPIGHDMIIYICFMDCVLMFSSSKTAFHRRSRHCHREKTEGIWMKKASNHPFIRSFTRSPKCDGNEARLEAIYLSRPDCYFHAHSTIVE